MRLLGDVPKEHQELARDLREIEVAIDGMIVPPREKAKAYVAMAHDWYSMGAEEEGHKLLLKAEKACAGYFTKEINEDTEDEEFAYLVGRLKAEIIYLLAQELTGDVS